MKRNVFIMSMVLGMTLIVSACGNKAGEAAGNETAAAENESTSEAVSEADTSADEAENGNVTVTQTSADGLKVKITSIESETVEAGEGENKLSFSGSFETIEVMDDGYESLKKSLKESDEAVKKSYDASYAENKDFMNEFADTSSEGDMLSWSMSNFAVPVRCDKTVFSYIRTDDSYLGGAHPNSYMLGYNFDSQTGEELKLSDVVTDYDKTREYVISELKRQKEEEDWLEYFDDYEETVDRMFNGVDVNEDDTDAADTYATEPSIQWTMNEDSIDIMFNRYDIASYAMGSLDVIIPYSSGLLNDKYFSEKAE